MSMHVLHHMEMNLWLLGIITNSITQCAEMSLPFYTVETVRKDEETDRFFLISKKSDLGLSVFANTIHRFMTCFNSDTPHVGGVSCKTDSLENYRKPQFLSVIVLMWFSKILKIIFCCKLTKIFWLIWSTVWLTSLHQLFYCFILFFWVTVVDKVDTIIHPEKIIADVEGMLLLSVDSYFDPFIF